MSIQRLNQHFTLVSHRNLLIENNENISLLLSCLYQHEELLQRRTVLINRRKRIEEKESRKLYQKKVRNVITLSDTFEIVFEKYIEKVRLLIKTFESVKGLAKLSYSTTDLDPCMYK